MKALAAAPALALALLLAACSSAPVGGTATTQPADPGSGGQAVTTSDPLAAAAELVQQRWSLVSAGDYAGACALYSDEFAAQFAELAQAAGESCVAAHEKAAQSVSDYLASAKEQNRAGLTPFFYIPSAIEVNSASLTSDRDDVAIVGDGAVTSLDPREFEDGAGKTPGWLAGLTYVMLGVDGQWRFIAPTEK